MIQHRLSQYLTQSFSSIKYQISQYELKSERMRTVFGLSGRSASELLSACCLINLAANSALTFGKAEVF